MKSNHLILCRPLLLLPPIPPGIIFLSREGRDLGVEFQVPPGSQASSRGQAKDSALLSSRDAGLLEPPEPRFPRLLPGTLGNFPECL